jgi:hypothetical protein
MHVRSDGNLIANIVFISLPLATGNKFFEASPKQYHFGLIRKWNKTTCRGMVAAK